MRHRLAPTLALWILAAPLSAQSDLDSVISEVVDEVDEETTVVEVEPQRTAPPLPPQRRQPRMPTMGQGDTVANIQFPNGDVRDILAFYEQLTGKQTIYDNTVQGKVNIVVNRQLTKEEAVLLLETALQINGFTIIPGPSEKFVKVAGANKNPRQFAIPIISDIADLPTGDQVVSFIFSLAYAEPAEVEQVIRQYVAESPHTAFVPLPKTQALMVTETSSVLRMVGRLIDTLDQPPAEVISEFITLERADAKEVVEKLTAMFEKSDEEKRAAQAAQPSFMPPWAVPPRPPQAEGNAQGNSSRTSSTISLSEDSLIIGKIRLTADERTNRIHVVTRPANIAFVRRLIEEYDANIAYGDPSRRVLRFVSAGDVLDVIVQAITEPGTKVEESATSTSSNRGVTSTANRGGGATSGGVNLGTEELDVPEIEIAPEARTVGNTRIIADKRANAIIVLGNNDAKEKIFRVLDEIDVRSPQVMITAVIGELTLDDGEEFGVDYIYHLGRELAEGRVSTTTITNPNGTTTVEHTRPSRLAAGISRNSGVSLTDLATLTSVSAFAGMPAGTTALIGASKSLDIIVTALEATGKFRITSRPMVFTSNNRKAIITSGEQIAVPQSTVTGLNTADSLVTNSTITYKDVLLKLEVVPLINSEREVTLDIVQEVNNVSGTTEISGNSIPTISARKIKTTVSVANEATIALGGLVQESVEDASSGIPILHRMPVIGPLFGNTKKKKRRTELIVLLRPTVIYDPAESSVLAEREQEKLNFPPDLEASLDHSAEQFFSHEPKEKPRQPATTRPSQRPPRFVPATRQ